MRTQGGETRAVEQSTSFASRFDRPYEDKDSTMKIGHVGSHHAGGETGGAGAHTPSGSEFNAHLNAHAQSSPGTQVANPHAGGQAPGTPPAPIQSGASVLGEGGEFSYDQPEKLTHDAISQAHNNLVSNGYLFAGWHGTSQGAATSMVNGDIHGSPFNGEGERHWGGLYVAHNVDTTTGYTNSASGLPDTLHEGAIVRTYVNNGATQHVLAAGTDINHIGVTDLPADIRHGTGNYVLSGPEKEGGAHEAVISHGLLGGGNTVVIPSLHEAGYNPNYNSSTLKPHDGEAQSIGPNILEGNGSLGGAE